MLMVIMMLRVVTQTNNSLPNLPTHFRAALQYLSIPTHLNAGNKLRLFLLRLIEYSNQRGGRLAIYTMIWEACKWKTESSAP